MSEPTYQVATRVSEDEYRRLCLRADKQMRSLSAELRLAVRAWLDNKEGGKDGH